MEIMHITATKQQKNAYTAQKTTPQQRDEHYLRPQRRKRLQGLNYGKRQILTQKTQNDSRTQITNTKKSFPKLPVNSAHKVFLLRQIGGITQDSINQTNPWLNT